MKQYLYALICAITNMHGLPDKQPSILNWGNIPLWQNIAAHQHLFNGTPPRLIPNPIGVSKNNAQDTTDEDTARNSYYSRFLFAMAEAYMHGTGRPKSFDVAIALYHEAAQRGVAEAQAKIAQYYRTKFITSNDKSDLQQHVYWLTKATKQEYPSALYNLGICYANAFGVSINDQKAHDLFQRAAAQEFAPAQHMLGLWFAQGRWVFKNEKKAADLFQQAADHGYAPAQYELGRCYHEGHGVPKRDLEQAKYHYRQAAEQGYAPAKEKLESLNDWL